MPPAWPDHITADDATALDALAAAGVGEGDFGEDHHVPPDLLELHEVLEWEAATGDLHTGSGGEQRA